LRQDILDLYRNSILELMKKNNIGISQLARDVNIPQPTLYRLLKGKTSDIRLSTLIEIADFFSVSVADLAKSNSENSIEVKNITASKVIPILSWKEVGKCWLNNNNKNDYFYPSVKCSENAFALKSKTAFEKTFSKDTIFVIDPHVDAVDGDFVIVSYKNATEATIRKLIHDGPIAELIKIDGSTSELITEEIKIIGPVLQSIVMHRYELVK
jgi:SOS-response transcriptional repressor LexA